MNKFFLMTMLFSFFSIAGNLSVKIENQQIIAKACNLKQNTKEVWFFVGQKGYAKNGIAQRENKFENNCAIKTYNNSSNDLFLKGGEVYASYDQQGKQPIQNNPETVQIPGGNNNQPPVNNPGNHDIKLSYKLVNSKVQVLICSSPEYISLGKVVAINNLTKQKSTGQYTGSTNLAKKMINENRCAEHFYDNKDIDNGDVLIVVIGDDTKEFTVKGLPTNDTPPPVVTPEDPRKEMDPKKVKIYAEQAANFFANRVVEIYGKVENYKYNFYVGFKKAASFYSNLGISIQNLPQYGYGQKNGLSKGYEDGYSHGQQKGIQEGTSVGRQDAVDRFYAAVENSGSLDVNAGAGPDSANYPGTNPSIANPDLNNKFTTYNNDYYQELKSGLNFDAEVEFDSDLNGNIYGGNVSLSDYYSWNDYKNEVLFSYWKSENALNLFLSKKLIKSTSVDHNKVKANNEMIAKYKEITDSNLYKDADQNRRLFRSTFINQYDDVIGYKWNKEVYDKSNYAAQSRGEYYFTQAIQAYAYDVGYQNGYIENYIPRNIQGYRHSVGPAYVKSFNETVNYYSNNPVISEVQLDIVNQDGKKSFSVIDNIIPVLSRVVNAGKVAGKLIVRIQQNNAINNAVNNTLEIEIPALTRFTSSQALGVVSQVSTSVKPEDQIDLVLTTNAGNKSVRMTMSWHQTVKQITKDIPQRQQILSQYLSQHLGKEMKDMRSVFKKNKYKHEPENTFAGKLVSTYQTLNPQEQQLLNQFQTSIVSGIGKRPRDFICIGCGKDEWDAAQNIFKQIGWSLPK